MGVHLVENVLCAPYMPWPVLSVKLGDSDGHYIYFPKERQAEGG